MISVIVLTKNNASTLSFTLKSLTWCDEIIIIDDFSEDKTIEIASKFTGKVYKNRLNHDFAAQRNFALTKAKGDWVLFVDADEIISESLKKEITRVTKPQAPTTTVGYYIKRKDYFLGRWLNFGETQNVKLLRLAIKGTGNWIHPVHEIWQIEGKTQTLESPLIHLSHSSVGQFLAKINRYSTLKATEKYAKKEIVNPQDIVLFPFGKFLQNYFLKKGFLDGEQGLIMALMMSFHSFLVRAKTYLKQVNK